MGLSRILDKEEKKKVKRKSDIVSCEKTDDCMFMSDNGNCSFEWCIFEELPKNINTSKTISCSICGKTESVSIYSGKTEYICPICINKINKLFNKNNTGEE